MISLKDGWDWSKEVVGDIHNEHQLIRLRRSEVSETIKTCYKTFFASSQPPSGFRTNHTNIRYICQQVPENPAYFYSTMFDLKYGIPIYSAYVVNKTEASKFGTAKRTDDKWRQEQSGEHSNGFSEVMFSRINKLSSLAFIQVFHWKGKKRELEKTQKWAYQSSCACRSNVFFSGDKAKLQVH